MMGYCVKLNLQHLASRDILYRLLFDGAAPLNRRHTRAAYGPDGENSYGLREPCSAHQSHVFFHDGR